MRARIASAFAPVALAFLAGCGSGSSGSTPVSSSTGSSGSAASVVPPAPSSPSSPVSPSAPSAQSGAPVDSTSSASATRYAAEHVTTAVVSGYSPRQIRHAYGLDAITAQGEGQIIAIIDAFGSPTIERDLATFSLQFGLPFVAGETLRIAYPTGKPSTTDAAWALETSLDVEWAHAIAPKARILLVVARGTTLTDMFAAIDFATRYVDPSTGQRAWQVAMSWGAREFPDETSYDAHFAVPGVTFFAATGDRGAGVEYPAASPFVVAVGGTTLKLDAEGNVLSETAWSQSGGGTSSYEAEPAWQRTWQTSSKRQVPDVSWNADPITGYAVYHSTPYSGVTGWFRVGGTSAGAPQWAGLMAVVNGQRSSSLDSCGAALGALGTPELLATNYRDIVTGSNATATSEGFQAVAGYDEVTGLGVPLASRLVPALVAR